MSVSRSGYYKWKARDNSEKLAYRREVVESVKKVHEAHPSHRYRWVCAFMYVNYNVKYCENYIYRAFKALGITAQTKHRAKQGKRVIKDKYPNLIFTTWETVDRPRQVIVSDMTAFKFWYFYFEVTFYFDVFTKEILTYKVAARKGDRNQYIDGLEDVKNLLKSQTEPVVLHTDQGSVYASMAYNELIKDTVIVRSMSRAGKPTDNPVNESINGWMKEELYMDFKIDECRRREEFMEVLNTSETDKQAFINLLDQDGHLSLKENIQVSSTATDEYLRRIGFEWGKPDERYIKNYVEFIKGTEKEDGGKENA